MCALAFLLAILRGHATASPRNILLKQVTQVAFMPAIVSEGHIARTPAARAGRMRRVRLCAPWRCPIVHCSAESMLRRGSESLLSDALDSARLSGTVAVPPAAGRVTHRPTRACQRGAARLGPWITLHVRCSVGESILISHRLAAAVKRIRGLRRGHDSGRPWCVVMGVSAHLPLPAAR